MWQQAWESSNTGSTTRFFIPIVKERTSLPLDLIPLLGMTVCIHTFTASNSILILLVMRQERPDSLHVLHECLLLNDLRHIYTNHSRYSPPPSPRMLYRFTGMVIRHGQKNNLCNFRIGGSVSVRNYLHNICSAYTSLLISTFTRYLIRIIYEKIALPCQ